MMRGMTTRRSFIGGAIAFAPLSRIGAADEKPILKILKKYGIK